MSRSEVSIVDMVMRQGEYGWSRVIKKKFKGEDKAS